MLRSERAMCSTSQPALAMKSLGSDKRWKGDMVYEQCLNITGFKR